MKNDQNTNQKDDRNNQRESAQAQEKQDTRTSGHIQSLGQGLSSDSTGKTHIGHHHYHDKDKGRNTDQNVGSYK